MKKFDYKAVGKEIGWNFSMVEYDVDVPSGFNYYNEVVKNIKDTTIMLDIGSGSAEKSARYYSLAKKVYLTDIEEEMLKKAKANVEKYYMNSSREKNKFAFKYVDCMGPFPFKDGSLDLVVSRHCGASMHEVYRVLKDSGKYLSEDYACDDCQELKEMFGRGQDYGDEPLYKAVTQECIEAGFSSIKLFRFEEIEYYKTIDDLKFLLHNTPILGGFDEEKDNEILSKYIEKFSTPRGIRLNRKLYAYELIK